MAIRYWMGVVPRDHVRIGVAQGIVQVNHGQRDGLDRMQEADGFVYYSPRESTPDGEPLKAFTAIGRIADDRVFQADAAGGGAWRPWRRRVDWYRPAVEAPIRPLVAHLDFTLASPNWGYQLRRGLIEISKHDFTLIRKAMRMPDPDDRHPADRVVAEASGSVEAPVSPRRIDWF